MTTGTARAERAAVPAPLLILGSVVSIQLGQACGKGMFAIAGTAGVVVLRLGFAAAVLLLVRRPPLPRGSAGLAVALGAAIAGMHLIYPAMQRLPVGVASAFQFLGPLALALAKARRPADLLWAALAGAGVFLMDGPGGAPLSASGVVLAVASGACMAAYLVLNKRAGGRPGSTLTWGVVAGAVLVLPLAPAAGGDLRHPGVLAAGLGLAVLSAVLPWSLDQAALRRLPERTVAVMVSLEPAAGAVAGLVLLGEHLAWTRWLAIGCVCAASTGAALSRRSSRTSRSPHPGGRGSGEQGEVGQEGDGQGRGDEAVADRRAGRAHEEPRGQ